MAMDPTKQDGSGDRKNISPIKAGSELVEKRLVRVPMARHGFGTKGNKVPILTNHFKVNASKLDGHFFHYSVALSFEDGHPVDGKGIGRKLLERVHEMYAAELDGKNFAYDGEKSLFTIGPLPQNKLEFTVVLEDVTSGRNTGRDSPEQGALNESDRKRFRRAYRSKTYKVEINFAAKIPMQAIVNALRGKESENTQEAIRVFDIILRQRAAKQGCLLVRQSFFHNDPRNFVELGGGVHGCRGFHSSFRTSQNGLSLNVDVTTTMTIQPGPVANFLVVNQNVRDHFAVDWSKAKRTLKNLRVKTRPTNQEHKITGLSERSCREQTFTLKQKGKDGDGETEITVYDYFAKHHNINLRYSANLPCINVGKPKRPTYFPIELCELVSLQRYTKALSTFQRASLVEKSRQKPNERKSALVNALKTSNYGADEMLKAAGVSINPSFMQVDGRVLPTPKLKVGNHEDLFARNGRWNFNNKRLINACEIKNWAVVNFSARCHVRALTRDLMKVARMKGVKMEEPNNFFNEHPRVRQAPALVRVEQMLEQIKPTNSKDSKFFLCLLPERKNCDIYGPWKRRLLSDIGVVTQCLSPTRLNDQYLTNLLLKINAKLGGLNSALASEVSRSIPMVSEVPTQILGMDVSHGSPGQSIPSIAAVVSSRDWPSISRYRACVRTQSPKVEMIDSLFRQVSDTEDRGIIRELLLDFYYSSRHRKPEQIIIFRDGVSESQFGQVLNIELNQIVKAWKFLETSTLLPKFVVVVAQKNHHTRFFKADSPDNVQPGTIIDNKVCHPRNNDFYLCAHAGMIGTTRPTHYHVLLDEVGFSADDLQELVHSLSYVYQRSTTAISVVAPVCYAHLAAAQLGQWMKTEDNSDTVSVENLDVPPMPKLHRDVESSMFFC